MDGFSLTSDWLWPAALGVVPLSLLAAGLCRWVQMRASTRHALWLAVMLCLFVPPIIPSNEILPARDGPASPVTSHRAPGHERSAPQPVRPAPAAREPLTVSARVPRDPIMGPPRPPGGAGRLIDEPLEPLRVGVTPVGSPLDPRVPAGDSSDLARSPQAKAPTVRSAPGVSDRAMTPPVAPPTADASTAQPPEPAPWAGDLSGPIAAADGSWLGARLGEQVRAWRDWLPQLGHIREAVATLPPMPGAIWVCGAGLLGALTLVRMAVLRRVIARAEPAPEPLRQSVASAARALGLRRPPEVLLIAQRVSPMVAVVGRARLLLPRRLWGELDEIGRDAVILHELAHLKRRDHWVCWAAAAASAIFWWHPVVWWVIGRLREEADACCDAWVTTLRPHHRRGYAQALLDTRAYLSSGAPSLPGVGLGVSGSGAKRFARRITMVMKERGKPRMSVWGLALALAVGAAGAASTPLWACPPDEKEKAEKASATARAHARHEAETTAARALKEAMGAQQSAAKDREKAMAAAQVARQHALQEAQRAKAIALDQAMREKAERIRMHPPGAQGGSGGAAADADDRRLHQVEERLNRLEEQLKRIEQLLERRGPRTMTPTPEAPVAALVAPSVPAAPTPAPLLSLGVMAPRGATTPAAPVAVASTQPRPPAAPTVVHALSAGARNRTTPGPAQATHQEQVTRTYSLPQGKREALWQLMSRQDVPVLVSSTEDGIQVHGTPRQQAVFAAFVNLIHPGAVDLSSADDGLFLRVLDAESIAALGEHEVARELLLGRIAHLNAGAAGLSAQADALWARAAEFEAQAEALEEQASVLEPQAEALSGADRAAMIARIRGLADQARALLDQARALEQEGDRLSDQAEELRGDADDESCECDDEGCDADDESCECDDEGCEEGDDHGDDEAPGPDKPVDSPMTMR